MEWTSLSLFTVLSETAVGLVVLYTLFGFAPSARHQPDAYGRLGRPVLLAAWVATAVAMLASLAHLGHPQVRLPGPGRPAHLWLSWEVLLTGLFALGALLLWLRARSGAPPAGAWGSSACWGSRRSSPPA